MRGLEERFVSRVLPLFQRRTREVGAVLPELHPKAVERLEHDWGRLVAYYDFPHEHWRHLRTTNVVVPRRRT